ncbi:MAG: hypothetical protein V3T90_08285 [Anaerolineae bacterium]
MNLQSTSVQRIARETRKRVVAEVRARGDVAAQAGDLVRQGYH